MLTNSLGSSFSAAFQFRCSLEGGIDPLDFSDHLDLDEHSLSSMKIDRDIFDDVFPEDGSDSQDDSSRDSFVATLRAPAERPSAIKSSYSLHTPSQADNSQQYDPMGSTSTHSGPASFTFNTETNKSQQYDPMGSTSTHSGPPSLMSGGAHPINPPRRRAATSQRSKSLTTPVPEYVQELQMPRRRKTVNSVPEYMQEFVARRAQGEGPAFGLDEFGNQDDHPMLDRIKRRKSLGEDSFLRNAEPTFGNEPFPADISIAVHEAQEKITRLRGLLGHDQQELMNDIVGGNNHPRANHQMAYRQPPAQSRNCPLRASEHGVPWAPSCPPHHFIQQAQQDNLQHVTMAKLQAAMERTNSTMKLLQDWDRAHGLPASHCQTMVNSSRSRKQLKEGVVLKKWNGSPLVNLM